MMKTKFKPYKEFPYKIDPKLERKLLKLLGTLEKKDIWILVDGDEGSGKSNTACYLLYWFHCMTGRDFSLDRFYFDSDEMLDWVKLNSNGLINWDEAILGGMSSEWFTKSQTNLLKFAMTGRKKHHIFILCVPRFNKLKEDLRKDRIHALIHMDLGKYQDDYGHFIYLTKRGIKAINRVWEKNKVKPYRKIALKYGGFCSNIDIPYVFNQLVDEEEYEKKKDKAIESIGEKKIDKYKIQLNDLQSRILEIQKHFDLSRKELADMLGINERTMYKWKKNDKKEDNL
jgi:DNA-binding XRE family transcriptional regulator